MNGLVVGILQIIIDYDLLIFLLDMRGIFLILTSGMFLQLPLAFEETFVPGLRALSCKIENGM